jgi:hypothetical protein
MDWLENISIDCAVAIARKALIEAGIPHEFVYDARERKALNVAATGLEPADL